MNENISDQNRSANKMDGGAASIGATPPVQGTYNYFLGANGVAGLPRPQSGLMSRREAATYLGVTEQTLAIWKCTGRYNLPCVKIGRLVKYRQLDLDAFIANNLKGALPPVC
jgi:hypothetical protein